MLSAKFSPDHDKEPQAHSKVDCGIGSSFLCMSALCHSRGGKGSAVTKYAHSHSTQCSNLHSVVSRILLSFSLSLIFLLTGVGHLQASGTLSTDLISGHSLSSHDKKAVVLIHGWNPDGHANPFAHRDWPKLTSALQTRLGGSSWKLMPYNWHAKANTGNIGINFPWATSGFLNASNAASNAFLEGSILADQLHQFAPSLERVLFIAHSAGAWAAYRAADKLLGKNPSVRIQVVLLDPFIPGVATGLVTPLTKDLMSSLASHGNQSRIDRLENYYSIDLTDTDLSGLYAGGGKATSQIFSWRPMDVNRQVDYVSGLISHYNISLPHDPSGHSGPIRFYADSVSATAGVFSPAFSDAPYGATNYGFFLAQPTSDVASTPLRVALSASRNPVSVGGSLVYSATVVNAGSKPLSAVELNLLLPAEIFPVRNKCVVPLPTTGTSWSGGESVSWVIGTLAAGQSWTAQMTVDINYYSVSNGSILRLGALVRDGTGRQSTASVDTQVGSGLELRVRAEPREVSAGDTVRFVGTYSNRLGYAAVGTALDIELPPGFAVQAASEGFVQWGSTLSWNLGSVPSGSGGQVEVLATAPTSNGSVEAYGLRAHFSEQFGTYAGATEIVVVRPTTPLRVTLSASRNTVSMGGSLVYTAAVLNTGTTPLSAVKLDLLLPSEIFSVRGESVLPLPTTGSSWSGGETMHWAIGTLAAGQSFTAQITADINYYSVTNGSILRLGALVRDGTGRQSTASLHTMVGNLLKIHPKGQGGGLFPPGKVSCISPSFGSIYKSIDGVQPVFQWTSNKWATWYRIYISRNGVLLYDQWVQGVTTWTPPSSLPVGNYQWWVQTWNSSGHGAWCSPGSFKVLPDVPTKSTPVWPSGSGSLKSGDSPSFSWTGGSKATWYQVYLARNVNGKSQQVWSEWFEGATIAQYPAELSADSYQWWVRGWNSQGYSEWSVAKSFTVTKVLAAQPAVSPAANPSAYIIGESALPTMTWQVASNATWYYVWISRNGDFYSAKWVEGGVTTNYSADLPAGSYHWWVQSHNIDGRSAWTDGGAFTVEGSAPGKAILTSPFENTTLSTGLATTLAWQKLGHATWYRIYVTRNGTKILDTWQQGGSSITRSLSLSTSGTYKFWVLGWNPMGSGPWSDALSFEAQ